MASTRVRDRIPPRLAAIVLVVSFLVMVVVYVIVTLPGSSSAPFVQLSSPTFGPPGHANLTVTEASREVRLGDFRVELRDVYGGTTVFAATLAPGVLYSNAGKTARFDDAASPGALGIGDGFEVANLPTGVTYSLILIFTPGDDRTVASQTIPL